MEKKKRQKRSHQFQFHCGVLQTSTAQSRFSCLPHKVGKREVLKKSRTHTLTYTHATSQTS